MVKMGMGDDDLTDALSPTHGSQDRRQMRRIVGAGVDDDKLGRADQPGVRPTAGQGRGVGRAQGTDRRVGCHRAAWLSKRRRGG